MSKRHILLWAAVVAAVGLSSLGLGIQRLGRILGYHDRTGRRLCVGCSASRVDPQGDSGAGGAAAK